MGPIRERLAALRAGSCHTVQACDAQPQVSQVGCGQPLILSVQQSPMQRGQICRPCGSFSQPAESAMTCMPSLTITDSRSTMPVDSMGAMPESKSIMPGDSKRTMPGASQKSERTEDAPRTEKAKVSPLTRSRGRIAGQDSDGPLILPMPDLYDKSGEAGFRRRPAATDPRARDLYDKSGGASDVPPRSGDFLPLTDRERQMQRELRAARDEMDNLRKQVEQMKAQMDRLAFQSGNPVVEPPGRAQGQIPQPGYTGYPQATARPQPAPGSQPFRPAVGDPKAVPSGVSPESYRRASGDLQPATGLNPWELPVQGPPQGRAVEKAPAVVAPAPHAGIGAPPSAVPSRGDVPTGQPATPGQPAVKADVPTGQPATPGQPPVKADLPTGQPANPGQPPMKADVPMGKPTTPGQPPAKADVPTVQTAAPGPPPVKADVPTGQPGRLAPVQPVAPGHAGAFSHLGDSKNLPVQPVGIVGRPGDAKTTQPLKSASELVQDSQKLLDEKRDKKIDALKSAFDTYLKSEDVRLSGAMATSRVDHPKTAVDKVNWLLQQGNEDLIPDYQLSKKMQDIGRKFRSSSVIAEEDALMERRKEQWNQVRINSANPADENMETKQALLRSIMTGGWMTGQTFGRMNDERPQALKTDKEQWKLDAAEALVRANGTKGIDHGYSTRAIVDGLRGVKNREGNVFFVIPENVRIKLLDAIIPMSADQGNKFLGDKPKDVALATVVTALERSHTSRGPEEAFQMAAINKLMVLKDLRAIAIIEKLSLESPMNKVKQLATTQLAELRRQANELK